MVKPQLNVIKIIIITSCSVATGAGGVAVATFGKEKLLFTGFPRSSVGSGGWDKLSGKWVDLIQ